MPSFKSLLTCAAGALLAGAASITFWLTGASVPLQNFFVLVPGSGAAHLAVPELWIGVALILAASLAVALGIERVGARRALPYLGGGFLGLAGFSLFASWYFSLNILFTPIAIAAALSAVLIQVKRLTEREMEFTQKLSSSSWRVEGSKIDGADPRLQSGLKLLETVLTPNEAVVFRKDSDGQLAAAARMRSTPATMETGRNSVWREGVGLCERAIKNGEMLVDKADSGDELTSIALPLRHEDETVGALLLRLTSEFDEEDRSLLAAVGGQMARNLQREESHNLARTSSPGSIFSTRGSRQKLQSLYVLNGALLEQRVGLNALAEVADGVALAYLDGRLAHTNLTLLALARLVPDEVRNLTFFQLLDSFRTDVFDEPVLAVRRVLQTGEPYERELHYTERSETYGLRISLVFDNANGSTKPKRSAPQPLGLCLTIKDLTREKELEQLKSDMISLMSHELRTPLTSINGFAELLTVDEDLPEQAKEFVTIIANESQRLSRMINTFLAVTKLERKDRQEVLKIPLRLDEVVRETIAALQPTAKKRRIRLVEQPAQKLPPVAADKSMITQAVKNLVGNAIKYSPERTTVTVSTALEADTVRLVVEDRGYGIPAEAKDRVWEKFYRVVREGEDKDEESTGLGLSFVREVVEQHGGSVDLESEVGRGSKFSFTLPRL
ncbi:MAG TPA: ATP-binding protein [Pyrinomonadaceae bacterium]|nr:ATP-binding protein [Pyrinomonadaceae bacterium]